MEAYEGWGGYGSAKAALDHLIAVLAVEEPTVRAYAFDPGDMRTQMHQDAFPGEDISDRPLPGSVVEILAGLLVAVRPSIGAYVVAAWLLGIIVNLVSIGDYYDIALRDFGLLVGALALARLAAPGPRVPDLHGAAPDAIENSDV